MKVAGTVRCFSFFFAIFTSSLFADTRSLSLERINDVTYAVVGPFGNRNPENLGNNSTSGFVITDDGVVLIDPGGSYKGAADIASLIKSVTDKPVIVVINTGGQDHRWMGNAYFKERGARIIASRAAVEDQKARTQEQYLILSNLVGDEGMRGTEFVYADETFDSDLELIVAGITFNLYHKGRAHTPGDSFVHITDMNIVFTGDIVYIGRMLGVMSYSASKSWIDVFDNMALLKPLIIVPGHGPVTSLDEAERDTYGYLVSLRQKIGLFIEQGGQIEDIANIDQQEYSHLVSFEQLKGRNAQQVFQEMEWE